MAKKPAKNTEPENEQEQNELEAIVIDDMLGASDWKKSKVGYLSGSSAISGIVKNQMKVATESVGRVSILFRMIGAKSDVPSLRDVEQKNYDAHEKFIAAMRLHRLSEGSIIAAQSNAKKSAYLYGIIVVAAIIYLLYGLVTWDKIPITTLMLHIAPIPLFGAFTFRAVYANYMFRTRQLPKIGDFLKSGDLMPR